MSFARVFPIPIFDRVRLSRVSYYVLLHAVFALFTSFSLFKSLPFCSLLAAIALVYLATLRQPHNSQLLSLVTYFTFVLLSSSYWLAYCLFDFLNVGTILSVLLLSSLFLCVSVIFSMPAVLHRYLTAVYSQTFSFSLLYIIFEYFRMQTFLATPWLNFANIAYNIPLFRYFLPIGGIYLTGYVLLRFAEAFIAILHGRYDKDARSLLLLCAFACAYHILLSVQVSSLPDAPHLSIRLLQANHNHLALRDPHQDWQDYITLLSTSKSHDFTLFPEGALSLSKADISLAEFSNYPFLKNSAIALNYRNNEYFSPMLIGTNDVHGSYQKQQLVPFGEYLPFTNFFGAYVPFFRSHQAAVTSPSSEIFSFRDFYFYPLICYDLFFTPHIKSSLRYSDAIIVSSENTFYRDSIFQAMFIRVAQIRAYESNTPVLLAMNRGYTSHISSFGDLIGQLPYDYRGVLSSTISKKNQTTIPPYLYLSDYGVLSLLCIFETSHLLYLRYIRRRQSVKSRS